MRIVAGRLRGRVIQAPDTQGTRPTTDRVREALMSSLYSMRGGFEGAIVLDAFAGSGALGIESLSRGAEYADFYEADRMAFRALEGNLRTCGLGSESACAHRGDVLCIADGGSARQYDLVFLDPPYNMAPADVVSFAAGLADAGLLDAEAIIVYEHAQNAAKEVAAAAEASSLELAGTRKYGKTGIAFLNPVRKDEA